MRSANKRESLWHPEQPRINVSGPVRNAARASLVEGAFLEITAKYPKQDRATRRAMARAAAKQHFRKVKGLPEIL